MECFWTRYGRVGLEKDGGSERKVKEEMFTQPKTLRNLIFFLDRTGILVYKLEIFEKLTETNVTRYTVRLS